MVQSQKRGILLLNTSTDTLSMALTLQEFNSITLVYFYSMHVVIGFTTSPVDVNLVILKSVVFLLIIVYNYYSHFLTF